MTALLGAILGDGERSCQEESQKEREGNRDRIPNGWCHKCGESRKKERYANRSQETNLWSRGKTPMSGVWQSAQKYLWSSTLTAAAKAGTENGLVTAALKRCATQNQVRERAY